ncbi:hypothetical protein [Mucilaginibacter dorajii]|uniref:Uncharacterized protein n=1 Tax=Mucilaginibacter dorajii TaxID=692994 RepID=A0ABP7P635_9SPHI|nr:hypothetical protein [Mucilaginibacter dorajii]MCS3734555.1 hypothetical protein [Mucilaginibacter dorajii]
MKKIIPLLLVLFISNVVTAQVTNAHLSKVAVMTPAFADTLKKNIMAVMPANYNIKLSYIGVISAEGKLLKPMVTKEVSDDQNSDFVHKMRLFILAAPAWQPALDDLNKPAESPVMFEVEVKNGKIKIVDRTK